MAETPEDGRLRPKHVVRGRGDMNSCIVNGIILCIKNTNVTGCLNTIEGISLLAIAGIDL
jgi:hypothetical protein